MRRGRLARLASRDRVPHRGRGARGQTLVEVALVLPAFLLLLMGLFDLGRVVYAAHTITQDSREASRRGEVMPAYSLSKYQEIRNAAIAMSPGVDLGNGNITGLAANACPTVPDPVDSNSCFYPDGTDARQRVVVNITVTVPLITPIISQIVGGSITVSSQSISYIQ